MIDTSAVDTSIDEVVVVIPARNEAETIGETVRSVDLARRTVSLRTKVRVRIVVVADACADATIAVAEAALDPDIDTLVVSGSACVGTARAIGVATALDASVCSLDRIWIANTDADTIVPANWIEVQLHLADAGFVGVAGIVSLNSNRSAPAVLQRRFDETYEVRDDGSHPHVHGTNLGVRADAYVRAGGWNPLPTAEDHDLWNRLRAVGRVCSTNRLVVATDPRRTGRAPDGFADDLAALIGEAS